MCGLRLRTCCRCSRTCRSNPTLTPPDQREDRHSPGRIPWIAASRQCGKYLRLAVHADAKTSATLSLYVSCGPHGGAERKWHDASLDSLSDLRGSPFRALDPHSRHDRRRGSGWHVPLALATRRGNTAAGSRSDNKAALEVTISRGEAPSGAAPFGTAPDEWSQAQQCASALKVTDVIRTAPAGPLAWVPARPRSTPRTNSPRLSQVTPVISMGAQSGRCAASVSWRSGKPISGVESPVQSHPSSQRRAQRAQSLRAAPVLKVEARAPARRTT
jgi:hypothetical protein